MINISSAELNYMILRYLNESGFEHTAFNFANESGLIKDTSIDGNLVPPSALVTFVQKGIQYLELEKELAVNDTDVEEDLSFISPVELLTKDVYELKQIVEEKKKQKAEEELEKEREREKGKAVVVNDPDSERKRKVNSNLADKLTLGEWLDCNLLLEENRYHVARFHTSHMTSSTNTCQSIFQFMHGNMPSIPRPVPMGISTTPTRPRTRGVRTTEDVLILEGHTSEVSTCAWSPSGSLLASGSGDSTARIWTVADRTNRAGAQNRIRNVCVLDHSKGRPNAKGKEVTTLNWNLDGTLLATGSNDGNTRLWDQNGELKSVLSKHRGPVVAVKWSMDGDYLLTGSFDNTSIVWDVNAHEVKQQFVVHSGPVLDADWRDNLSFASGSADFMVSVCEIGANQDFTLLIGHTGEVNCVKWSPNRSLLASCSDDSTVKVWSSKQTSPLRDFRNHTKEIFTIRWSPTGPATANPNKQLLLASGSCDSTVKLWDVQSGNLLSSLNAHREAVYTLSFSPNGEYLASGSMDRCMHVWSLKDGKIVKSYSSNGSIFDISWDKNGDKIAACTNNNRVCVLDLRM
ncbi:WD40 repeat-containing protein HOS15-like [Rutidosis leptorrhynchoides]|uniref:WD40 repeat-containing protein HOS15-like n=1 Tax=Rutidosis leptorrhynchoides TaxID=125765 RepID=UPI003A9A58CE